MAGFGSGWSHTMTGVRVCYVCLVVLWWWARVQRGQPSCCPGSSHGEVCENKRWWAGALLA